MAGGQEEGEKRERRAQGTRSLSRRHEPGNGDLENHINKRICRKRKNEEKGYINREENDNGQIK